MERRDFMREAFALGAVLAGGAAGAVEAAQPGARAPQPDTPQAFARDLAIVNGRIMTLEARQPEAQAALVRAGRIALVGSNSDVRGAAGGMTVFDARGRTVVPGFVDGHCHMEVAATAASYMVPLQAATSIRQVQDALRDKGRHTPPEKWIIGRAGFGLAESMAEKRMPTREELDAVTQDRPVMVFAGRHVTVLNTRALKEIGGWDYGVPLKNGALIERDRAGVPTGLAYEVYYFMPEYSVDEAKTAIKAHVRGMFVANGLTTLYTMPYSPNEIRADLELQASGELPVRLRMYYHVPHVNSLEGILRMGWISGTGGDLFRFGGVKVYVDGGGGEEEVGHPNFIWTQPDLNHVVTSANDAGIQVLIHIASREALERALTAVAEARRKNARPELLHRIEHAGNAETVEEIRRMRDLGVRPSITPSRGRANRRTPRYRTFVQESCHPAVITDATGTVPDSTDVLSKIVSMAIEAAEGGGAPAGETLGFEDALRAFTIWNARIGYEDRFKGSIAPGKLGDFVVLSGDPRQLRGQELYTLKVDATILGGEVVYER